MKKRTIFLSAILIAICFAVSSCDKPKEESKKLTNHLDTLFNEYGNGVLDASIVSVYVDYVSDSLQSERAKWIKESLSAASYNMTGGDYEDPDDLVRQLEETSARLFTRRCLVEHLKLTIADDDGNTNTEIIPFFDLTSKGDLIFQELKKMQREDKNKNLASLPLNWFKIQ
ncbi:MAG: hypothetical protein WA101_03370 [Minisyncoccia bacterium]